MPINNRADISALKGWKELSQDEKNAWYGKYPSMKGKTIAEVSRIYDNTKFADVFGKDALTQISDKSIRDQMLRERAIGKAFSDEFADDANFAIMNTLTPDGKMELLQSGYQTDKQIEDVGKPIDSFKSPAVNYWLESMRNQSFMSAPGMRANNNVEKTQESLKAGREFLLSKIVADDNVRKAETISKEAGDLTNFLLSTKSADEINADFESVAGGEYGSPYYNAFKDAPEMQDFSTEEKAKLLAEITLVSQKYGEPDAYSLMNTRLQDYVADNQNFFQYWVAGVGQSIVTKGVSNIANSILAYQAMYKGMTGGDEALANFLEGKADDGSELPWYANPAYWEGVDTFNTFSSSEIKRARENGGVSKNQAIVRAGNERGLKATAAEGIKMAGFMWSGALMNKALGVTGRGAAKLAGAKFTPNGMLDKSLSTKAGAFINNKALPAFAAFNSGMGISMAYGMGTYTQALDEMNQQIDSQIQSDAQDYARRFAASEGYSDAVRNEAMSIFAQIQQNNPDLNVRLEDIDEQKLYAQAEQNVLNNKMMEFLHSPQVQESEGKNYAADRDEARKNAASAFAADFIVEELRMTAAGLTWKTYLYDKGTREAMRAGFPGLRARQVGDKLVAEGLKSAPIKAVASNLAGGFTSNYLDDATVAFGKAFGLNKQNNYMLAKYDPEKFAEANEMTTSFLGNFLAGVQGFKEGMLDSQSFYDGLVGALGSVAVASPRLGALRKQNRGITMADVASGNNTMAEFANQFVFNPLLQEYSESQARGRQFQGAIDAANENIAKHKAALQDITELSSALNGFAETRINGLSDVDSKDAKAIQAFTVFNVLDSWMQDPIYSQSDVVQQAYQELEDLRNYDKLPEKRKAALINEFLNDPANKSVAQLENPVEFAEERLKSNAAQLNSIKDAFDESKKILRQSKDLQDIQLAYGNEAVDDLITELTFMKVMDSNWTERLNQMESEISGMTTPVQRTPHPVTYGSKSHLDNTIKVQNELVEKLIEAHDEAMDELDKLKASEQTDETRQQTAVYNLEVGRLTRELKAARNKLKELRNESNNYTERIVSADEIISLNPVERAELLNERNEGNYSAEQQHEIEQAKKQLMMKDPSLLEKVQDAAEVYQRREDARDAFNNLISHPQEAVGYYQRLKYNRDVSISKVLRLQALDKAVSNADKIRENLGEDIFLNVLKHSNTEFLDHYVEKHPDDEGLVNSVRSVVELRSDARDVIDRIFAGEENEAKRIAMSELIDEAIDNSGASMAGDLMSYFEQQIWDNRADSELVSDIDKLLGELETIGHQRDATIRGNVQKKLEANRKRKETLEKKKDGKNYGWTGFKAGDTVYDKDGIKGTVKVFGKMPNGADTMMAVEWEDGSSSMLDSADNSQRYSVMKEAPQTVDLGLEDEVKPQGESMVDAEVKGEVTGNVEGKIEVKVEDKIDAKTPVVENPLVSSDESKLELSDEGETETPVEAEYKEAILDPDTSVVPQAVVEPEDTINKEPNVTGTFLGNTMYGYNNTSLISRKAVERRVGKKAGDSMNSFFKFLDDNKIKLQEIVDYELKNIFRNNKNTKVYFMRVNQSNHPELGNFIFNVVKYTDAVARYHNEERGGVIQVGTEKYLIIGTAGFNPVSKAEQRSFSSISTITNRNGKAWFRNNPSERFFVDESMYTQIADIGGGRLVRILEGEEYAVERTIGELFDDSYRNPHGLNFTDAVFGIMMKDDFITSHSIPDAVMYSPMRSESNTGRVFLMVPATPNRYIPVALKAVTLNELVEGSALQNRINQLIFDLTDTNYETREEAIKQLSSLLVLSKGNNNILIGNRNSDLLSVKRHGVVVFSQRIGSNEFDRSAFIDEINSTPFRVNLTLRTLKNEQALKEYDAAGALKTDIGILGTVNSSYSIFEVGSDGKPVIKEIKVPEAAQKTGVSVYGTTALVDGKTYRVTNDGEVVDSTGKPVDSSTPNASKILTSVGYITRIDGAGVMPDYTTKSGERLYVLNSDKTNPEVVKRTPDNFIIVADKESAVKAIDFVNQKKLEAQREQEAKRQNELLEAEAAQRAQSAFEMTDADFYQGSPQESWQDVDLGDEMLSPELTGQTRKPEEKKTASKAEETRKPQQKPAERPKQNMNVPGEKSLAELQNPTGTITFESIMGKRRKELNKLAEDKGWAWGTTTASKRAFIEENLKNIDLNTITNENDFIKELKNCK